MIEETEAPEHGHHGRTRPSLASPSPNLPSSPYTLPWTRSFTPVPLRHLSGPPKHRTTGDSKHPRPRLGDLGVDRGSTVQLPPHLPGSSPGGGDQRRLHPRHLPPLPRLHMLAAATAEPPVLCLERTGEDARAWRIEAACWATTGGPQEPAVPPSARGGALQQRRDRPSPWRSSPSYCFFSRISYSFGNL
jgi:hypothetical protein